MAVKKKSTKPVDPSNFLWALKLKVSKRYSKTLLKDVKFPFNGEVLKRHIPKVSSPSENKLSDFGPLAPFNFEGKLFFNLVSKPLETHLIHLIQI